MKNTSNKTEEKNLYQKGPMVGVLRTQLCPICKKPMGDMPGSRDAICKNCGYKDPCCE